MERETVEQIVSQLTEMVVTFEQAVSTTGRTIKQGVAYGLIGQARAKLIEDLALLPQDALEVAE